MYTTYRIRTDELNDDFLTSLKTLFRDKTIEIAVGEADDESEDETAYLLRDPANRRRLMDAIENVRQGRIQPVDQRRQRRLQGLRAVLPLTCSSVSRSSSATQGSSIKPNSRSRTICGCEKSSL